jgi:hypothetical protein
MEGERSNAVMHDEDGFKSKSLGCQSPPKALAV